MYTLFLYKTSGMSDAAPCVRMGNKTLASYSSDAWKKWSAEDDIKPFDTSKVKDEIESRIKENNKGSYELTVRSSPNKKAEYIRIAAVSYTSIAAIIGVVLSVAVENELVLYDAVKKRYFYYKDICDVDYLAIRERVCAFNKAITAELKPIYYFKKLGSFYGGEKKIADYVITLRKCADKSLAQRTMDLYHLLKDNLLETETLHTSHRCFTIHSEYYQISYTLEAYAKCADRVAFIKDGQPCAELMRRMSCKTAFRWADKNMNKRHGKYDYCMYKAEMVAAFPNPADRFVKGINIEKQRRREKFGMAYCDTFGGAVDFSVYSPWITYEPEEISTLAINEDDAIPIFEIIEEFYPYFYERFYEENHLPLSMMRNIVDKMKEVREILIHDTFSDRLKPYLDDNYCFLYLAYKDGMPVTKLYDEFHKNRREFIYRHRYEAARLFDVFIDWAEKQLDIYSCSGNSTMIKIVGP